MRTKITPTKLLTAALTAVIVAGPGKKLLDAACALLLEDDDLELSDLLILLTVTAAAGVFLILSK